MAPQQLLRIGLLILWLTLPAKTTVGYTYFCNPVTYTSDDPFATSINDVLVNLALNNWEVGNDAVFKYESPASTSKAYGSAACSSGQVECGSCILDALNTLIVLCPNATGAHINDYSPGCTIRYEEYNFF